MDKCNWPREIDRPSDRKWKQLHSQYIRPIELSWVDTIRDKVLAAECRSFFCPFVRRVSNEVAPARGQIVTGNDHTRHSYICELVQEGVYIECEWWVERRDEVR